jgi:Gram-negative bacterial TonB protein C-terminal
MLDTRRRTKLSLIGRTFAGMAVCVLVAFAIAMGLLTRSGMGAARLQESPQGEPPLATVPLQLENGSQFSITVIEASVEISKLVPSKTGGVNRVISSSTMKEQPKNGATMIWSISKDAGDKTGGSDLPLYDALKASHPSPNLVRDLKYIVKIINKGTQPITRLKLEIMNPVLLEGQRIPLRRTWGKVSDGLGMNEVYTFSDVYSIGDKVDDSEVMNNLPYFRLRVADLSYEDDFDDLQTASMNDMLRSQPEIESEEMSPSLKPTILRKEKAEYTPEARAKGVEGTVVLSVVFPAYGLPIPRVLRILRGLPYGLSAEAVSAALKMRFHPAMKDGVPVSVRGNVEFDFKLDEPGMKGDVNTSGGLPIASRPQSGDGGLRIQFSKGVRLKTAITVLGKQLGLNVVYDDSIEDTQQIDPIELETVTIEKALDLILRNNKCSFEQVDGCTVRIYAVNPAKGPASESFESFYVKVAPSLKALCGKYQ